MKIVINLLVELPADEDQLQFWTDFADSPVPREGESIHFDLAHGFVVDHVRHMFPEGGARPEVWLYCVQTKTEAGMGYTVDTYREYLSGFSAVTWED